ncbi:MAG: hypothetical protein OXE52_15645, partial [Chloroflexi bacterium]|nr:hypothetical protein [Chloroflexota bacterium]
KFKHKSNQICHSKLGGYAACRQSLACSLASTLILSSIFLPQTKTLPEFWGKCVQNYRTTTGGWQNCHVLSDKQGAGSPKHQGRGARLSITDIR